MSIMREEERQWEGDQRDDGCYEHRVGLQLLSALV